MTEDVDEPLDDALAMIEDFDPPAVAKALPNFKFSPALEARLLLVWDTRFAKEVLSTWTPSDNTWLQYIWRTKDDTQAVDLLLGVLGIGETRKVISTAGQTLEGGRLASLMKALRAAKQQRAAENSEPGEQHSITPSSLARTPYVPPSITVQSSSSTAPCPTTSTTPPAHVTRVKSTKSNPTHDGTTETSKVPERSSNTMPAPLFPSKQPIGTKSTKARALPSPARNDKVRYTVWLAENGEANGHPKASKSSLENLFGADDIALRRARSTSLVSKPSQNDYIPLKNLSNIPHLDSRARIPLQSGTGLAHGQASAIATSPTSKSPDFYEENPSHEASIDDESPSHDARTSRDIHVVSRSPTPPPSPLRDHQGLGEAHAATQRHRAASFPAMEDFDMAVTSSGVNEKDTSDPPTKLSSQQGIVEEPSTEVGQGRFNSKAAKAAVEDDPEDGDDEDDDSKDVDEAYPDGYVDPTAVDPWKWSQSKNDAKVLQWGVEEMIEDDPRSTAPARAKWMYDARKGDMDDDEYAKLMEEEHRAFLAIPVACRTAVGQMWYKDSKLDWEIRVFWAPLVLQYAMLKDKLDDAEEREDAVAIKENETDRKALADEAMAKLMKRFPDCKPNHEKRRIKEMFGTKEEGKYLAKFRNKFTSDAGRMKRLYQESLGKISALGSNSSLSTLMDILGRKRKHIAFHLWGGSEAGGKAECDAEIEMEMETWVESNPTAKPQEATRHRIKVVQRVRSERFKLLDGDVKQLWTKRAKAIHKPNSIEEEQCLVDAALPYVVDLLKVLADRANMHFVLLASSRGSCNIPIVIQEFARKNVEQVVFLSATDGLGARMRTDYITYAVNRFGGDVTEAVVGVPMEIDEDEDDTEETREEITAGKGSKAKPKIRQPLRQSYIPAFAPDLSETKTTPKMSKAVSEFILTSIEKLHGIRPTWDKLTKSIQTYIYPERMPMDPEIPTQRLQFQKPGAMSDSRVKALFLFLVASYNGSLSEEESFRFKLESRHLNLPAPTPPSDLNVHHAAVFAAKTHVTKQHGDKSSTAGRKKKGPKRGFEEIDDDEGYENFPGIMQELEAANLEDAFGSAGVSKSKPKTSNKGKSLRIESPPLVISEPTGRGPREVPSATTAPDKPVKRPRPRPKSALDVGVDELSHPLFVPGDESTSHLWIKTKDYLETWAGNMTYTEDQSRTMPFRDVLGSKPDIQLPGGLYSSFSILQLWNAYQPQPSKEGRAGVPPCLGLNTIHPSHHISKIIALVTSPENPLPSAKYIYEQSWISSDAAEALFLHIELVVSGFMDQLVASEEIILKGDIDLLKGMRLAVFMGATGFIRDIGTAGVHTKRTSVLTDRFVEIVAAVAFARYFRVVLGRVANLYAESSQAEAKRLMWTELDRFWEVACCSLARALVHRRSDIFSTSQLRPALSPSFISILDYAFTARPWWTPGSSGAPGPIQIKNKQFLASDALFNLLKGLDWSKLTFIERGHVMLLVFIGAVQIENDRVPDIEKEKGPGSSASLLQHALQNLRKFVEASSEVGPVQESILVPSETISHWISKWEMECQVTRTEEILDAPEPPDLALVPTLKLADTVQLQTTGEVNDTAVCNPQEPRSSVPPATGASSCLEKAVSSNLKVLASCHTQPKEPARSSMTDQTTLPPEDEDPVFAHPQASAEAVFQFTHHSVNPIIIGEPPAADNSINQTIIEEPPAAVIPAVRALEDPQLPPAKKKRSREVEKCSLEEVQQPGRNLRTRKAPEQSTPTVNKTRAVASTAAGSSLSKPAAKGRGASSSKTGSGRGGRGSGRGRGRGRGRGN